VLEWVICGTLHKNNGVLLGSLWLKKAAEGKQRKTIFHIEMGCSLLYAMGEQQ
jgi:hypothetical protein